MQSIEELSRLNSCLCLLLLLPRFAEAKSHVSFPFSCTQILFILPTCMSANKYSGHELRIELSSHFSNYLSMLLSCSFIFSCQCLKTHICQHSIMRYQNILPRLLAMTQVKFSGVVAVLDGSCCLFLNI